MAEYFRLSNRKVSEVLDFLLRTGMCETSAGRYTVGKSHISLSSDSPLLTKHHANWRQRAIASLDKEETRQDLHYSAVVSLSRKDSDKLKEEIMELLKKHRDLIRDSKEETVFAYTIDLFELN